MAVRDGIVREKIMADLIIWTFGILLAVNVIYIYVRWRAMFTVGDEILKWITQERKDVLEQIPTNLRVCSGHVIARYVKSARILSDPEFDRRYAAFKRIYRHQLIGALLFLFFVVLMTVVI